MKKIKLVTASVFVIMSLAACSNAGGTSGTTAAQATTTATQAASSAAEESNTSAADSTAEAGADAAAGDTAAAGSNILIAYYSFPETDGVDTNAGASRVVVDGELYGNTQYLAAIIQENTGADVFRIDTVQEYPGLHDPLVDQAAEELDQNARPELSALIENLDDYDVIFMGYPNWWGDMPMPLYTFLEEHDLSGKTVIPFNSHGGSRFSGTIGEISSLQPNAEVVTDGFTVSRNSVGDARADLEAWLQQLGYGA